MNDITTLLAEAEQHVTSAETILATLQASEITEEAEQINHVVSRCAKAQHELRLYKHNLLSSLIRIMLSIGKERIEISSNNLPWQYTLVSTLDAPVLKFHANEHTRKGVSVFYFIDYSARHNDSLHYFSLCRALSSQIQNYLASSPPACVSHAQEVADLVKTLQESLAQQPV